MNAREEAEQLRQEAISKLLEEQKAIEQQLELLGYGKENASARKRRGRPPKTLESRIGDAEQDGPLPAPESAEAIHLGDGNGHSGSSS